MVPSLDPCATLKVARELGKIVGGVEGEGGLPHSPEEVAALKEKLQTLRDSIVADDAVEKAIIDRCQKVRRGSTNGFSHRMLQ